MSIETKEKSPGERALFHYQYGMFMLRCDRAERAADSFDKLQDILKEMIANEERDNETNEV